MLQTLNTLAGKISPHNGSDSGRLINNNIIANNNNTYNNNDKYEKLKRKIFSVNTLEDESTVDLKHLLFIRNSFETYGSATFGDWKITKHKSKYRGRKIMYILRKTKYGTKNKSKILQLKQHCSHRNDTFKMEPILNRKKLDNNRNIKKDYGLLCFDGTDENSQGFTDLPQEIDSASNRETVASTENIIGTTSLENESEENFIETPMLQKLKSPTTSQSQSLDVSSYHSLNPFSDIDKKMAGFLAKKPTGCIMDLKDSMRAKLYGKIFSENYILEQIDDYQNLKRKKKEAIKKQIKIINKVSVKKSKKPMPVRKYFYIRSKKEPAWKDEIETSCSSVTELNTEVEEPEELVEGIESESVSASEKQALEKSQQSHVCEESDQSISCPSETDSESCCICNASDCTCREYARFQNFLSKKYEKDIKTQAAKEVPKLTKEHKDRWDDLCNLDEVSRWSEETSLEVSSTSNSSCGIVRKCHCSHCNCGCDEYREYLLYKLYQVASRKRKRYRKRIEKAETLQRIIDENYKEDEYNRTVRELISKYYLKPDESNNEPPNVCDCGLYNCNCRQVMSIEESISNDQKDKKGTVSDILKGSIDDIKKSEEFLQSLLNSGSRDWSLDDERRKVWFGSQDATAAQLQQPSVSVSQKTALSGTDSKGSEKNPTELALMGGSLLKVKSKSVSESTSTGAEEVEKESEDIYGMVSQLLETSDSILKFNIDDYIAPDEEPQAEVIQSDASSYGSFDHKTYLAENQCNCEDYLKYYKFKKKTRRLAEKNDPILKYFRKRLLYVSTLAIAEKVLNKTSSDTESPVRGPEMRICRKYKFNEEKNAEIKKKIFKKKNRKLEKKAILDIIKKGNHLYPCDCNFSRKKKDKLDFGDACICEECQVHLKTNDSEKKIRKTKIEPSIALGEIDEKDCVLGKARTFPECPICIENLTRIKFTDKVEHRSILEEQEFGESFNVRGEIADRSEHFLTNLTDQGKGSEYEKDAKAAGEGEKESKIKQVSKKQVFPHGTGKNKKKKNKKGKPSKKKGGGDKKKKPKKDKKKKEKPKKKKKETNEVQNFSASPEKGLDVAVSIFDPRIVFKFHGLKRGINNPLF